MTNGVALVLLLDSQEFRDHCDKTERATNFAISHAHNWDWNLHLQRLVKYIELGELQQMIKILTLVTLNP